MASGDDPNLDDLALTEVVAMPIMVFSILVFFMQIGFALLEVGSVRSKNATSILFKNILDLALGTLAFIIIGYAIAKGAVAHANGFMSINANNIGCWDVASYVDVIYLLSFACVTCTIMSGALAERAYHGPYGAYAMVVAGFIFPTVAYWVWSPYGWLFELGYLDTAGSSVVHVVGGVSSMVVAHLIGPRSGRYNDRNEAVFMPGHNMPLMAIGGLIIWLGCFSFNSVSVIVSASTRNPGDFKQLNYLVGRCCINVLVSTGTAFCVGYTVSVYTRKSPLTRCLNSTITGAVAICAGCMTMAPWAAAITGICAGVAYFLVSLISIKLRIDDPVDAVAIHFGGGCCGIMCTAFFSNDMKYKGVFFGSWRMLWVQFVGVFVISLWAATITLIYWLLVRMCFKIRIPIQAEKQGLDITLGTEPAYPENYAMGDFIRFREFLETSWIATDARQAMSIFDRRQSAAGLPHQYYQTDAQTVMQSDRTAYHARRGSAVSETIPLHLITDTQCSAPNTNGTNSPVAERADSLKSSATNFFDKTKSTAFSILGRPHRHGQPVPSPISNTQDDEFVLNITSASQSSIPSSRPYRAAPPLPPPLNSSGQRIYSDLSPSLQSSPESSAALNGRKTD